MKVFCQNSMCEQIFENGLLYCYFALSAMEKYSVKSLLKNCPRAMLKRMVSMATHNAILVNGGIPTKTTIS